jgi:hypothetical protein
MADEAPLTITVPEAGKKYFGLSRNAAYDAAARGDLPVIKIGRPRSAHEACSVSYPFTINLIGRCSVPESGHDRKLL